MTLPLLLLACQPAVAPAGPALDVDAAQPFEALPAPRLLRRLSLDLRGVLPSLAELEAVEADPAEVARLQAAWLADPGLEERLVALLAERWLTLAEGLPAQPYDYDLDSAEIFALNRAAGEEPLRLVARAIVEDRPYSDVTTWDQTLADPLLASIWPVEGYPEGGTGWQPVRYTDGRPAAGVLATNGLWWRYDTTPFNQNRSRAAALARLLVCEDLLTREVSFEDRDGLLETQDTTAIVSSSPDCVSCHAIIEPLAVTLFGFYWYSDHGAVEVDHYHPEREQLGEEMLGVTGAWWGEPVYGLEDLGVAISLDPRFSRCAAETWTELLYRRSLGSEDFERLNALTAAFEASGLRGQALLADILDSPEYRAGGLTAAADARTLASAMTARTLTPSLLKSVTEDLSGYVWSFDGEDALTGVYQVVGGGLDGDVVTQVQPDPTVPYVALIERLAQASSGAAAETLGASGALAGVDRAWRPGDPRFSAALDDLVFRLLGRRPSPAQSAATLQLWRDVFSLRGDPTEAWAAVLTALLRDPEFTTY